MNKQQEWNNFITALASTYPKSFAYLYGNGEHPNLFGTVLFFPLWDGTLVMSTINGLPYDKGACNERVFGYHIHEGSTCTGDETDPFKDTGMHYDLNNCKHPHHTGDMPPLFGNTGYAFQMFYTTRFRPEDVVGHTCVIHDMPDDFISQPSGNSGIKIACGEIRNNLD